jgi:hypothetical protein
LRWPEKIQGNSDASDSILLERARKRHPNVKWWWNRRVKDNKTGAYCYICDKMICTFASNYPPTKAAIKAVQAHRQAHIAENTKNINNNY